MVSKADIALVRSLADKRSRREHGLFVVEGVKMVEEALRSGFAVRRVFGCGEFSGVPGCEMVSEKELGRMSALKTPQGVLALVEIPQRTDPAVVRGGLLLALDGIQDPGNMGTIIRCADWFGIERIVCSPDSADCFNPKVVQASMGAIFRVAVDYGDLPGLLATQAAGGTPVFGTFLEGEDIYTADLGTDPAGIVTIGNEGSGISEAVARTVTRRLFIPPYPAGGSGAESLNAAVAAAIVCSEMRRRSRLR